MPGVALSTRECDGRAVVWLRGELDPSESRCAIQLEASQAAQKNTAGTWLLPGDRWRRSADGRDLDLALLSSRQGRRRRAAFCSGSFGALRRAVTPVLLLECPVCRDEHGGQW